MILTRERVALNAWVFIFREETVKAVVHVFERAGFFVAPMATFFHCFPPVERFEAISLAQTGQEDSPQMEPVIAVLT